jgi:hypothetical protein
MDLNEPLPSDISILLANHGDVENRRSRISMADMLVPSDIDRQKHLSPSRDRARPGFIRLDDGNAITIS